jgi:ketosteroid isomerase-like protein
MGRSLEPVVRVLSDTAPPMSKEHLEAIHRGLEAFNRRDVDAYLALMHDDVEAVSRLAIVEGGFHGHDGIRSWLENIFTVWPDVTAEIGEAEDFGDVTLICLHLRGSGSGSDLPLEWTVWQAARWRDGKVCWWASFNTRAEALKAADLPR